METGRVSVFSHAEHRHSGFSGMHTVAEISNNLEVLATKSRQLEACFDIQAIVANGGMSSCQIEKFTQILVPCRRVRFSDVS